MKIKFSIIPLLFVFITIFQSFNRPNETIKKSVHKNIEKNDVSNANNVILIDSLHVKIGKQVWCLNNLDVVNYRNGDRIANITNKEDWKYAQEGAWCYSKNKVTSRNGKLYNFMAVIDSRGIAPKGYHIPSVAEWTKLVKFLKSKNLESSILNQYFFKGIEGIWRTGGEGQFDNSKNHIVWWSSSDAGSYAYSFSVDFDFQIYSSSISQNSMHPNGFYVRCIKNNNP